MRRDVIIDKHARMYEIPRQLARMGHEVLGVCLAYRYAPAGFYRHEVPPGILVWEGYSLGGLIVPGLVRYITRAKTAIESFKPDALIGASDSPHIVWTSFLAGSMNIPYVVDLYDNFESFGLSRVPGLVQRYRDAVRRADVVSCVSDPLSDKVRQEYGACGDVVTLETTVDKEVFFPRDRAACRDSLGLPQDGLLIGTAGALSRGRGIDLLYQAFATLANEFSDLHLVLAGKPDRHTPLPIGARVHYLGELAHSRVAELYGALDVSVVCIRDTEFGRYSFPQKAYEILACEVPVVVAEVGAMGNVLSDYPSSLYAPDDLDDLTRTLRNQLRDPVAPKTSIPSWAGHATTLNRALRKVVH